MNSNDLFNQVLRGIASSFQPLTQALTDQSQMSAMLNDLGWRGLTPQQISSITQTLENLAETLDNIEKYIGDDSTNQLMVDLPQAIAQIHSLANTSTLGLTDFWKTLPQDLIDYLLYSYIKNQSPLLYGALNFRGVLLEDPTPADSTTTPLRGAYTKRIVDWSNLLSIVTQPTSFLKQVYGWGTSPSQGFNYTRFTNNTANLLQGIGFGVSTMAPTKSVLDMYYPKDSSLRGLVPQIIATPFQLLNKTSSTQVMSKLMIVYIPIPPDSDSTHPPDGFALFPILIGSVDADFKLSNTLDLQISGGLSSTDPILIEIHPGKISIKSSISGDGSFKARLSYKPIPDDPIILFGSKDSSHFGISDPSLTLIAAEKGNDYNLGGEIALDNIELVIAKGDGDGFIQKILPDDTIKLQSPLTLGINNTKGFYIKGGGSSGSAAIEYAFQINKTFGPITVTTLDLRLETKEEAISLITAISANAEIGPVSASVEKIGLEAMLDFSKKGALGNADIGFGFKPPTGVGLSIDASVIKGGGYLSINDGNYAGILQLEIANKVSITAIGILTTRMPDGTKIFSLKFLGMVEFPPVQLGFGIFLNGVGLAVAIHCSMNAEALKKSVYTGSLSSLLFPPDPIKNAVKIISDLQSFFPPEEGCYAFGVMAKLGWGGVKALVQAEVGVFIELANGKFRKIALAGIAKCILPTDDNQILHIEFQVIGIIDFSNDTFSIDASLEKSFILIFNLDGDIALRACWGDNPRFALSIGGFYPGFVAPNNFPRLRRMSISLGSDNPRIGLLSYMAITENSVQIGAALLFHYEKKTSVGYFEVDGGMGFDALFEFNPFYFETKMYAYLALKRNHKDLFNVRLDLTLSGPNNWHAVGYAKFEVLCVDVTVSFDETFGEKRPEIPPPVVSPLEALTSELIDRHNWSVLPPKYGAGKVTFRKNAENEPYVDPFGEICFRQKSIPFGINIEKYGNSDINPDECYFEIKPDITNIGSSNAPAMKDEFSPGTYKKLTDQEKISAKAFEQMNSGFKISVDKVELGSNKENNVIVYGKDLCYNTISPNSGEKPTHGGFVMPQSLINSQFITGQKYYNKFNAKSPSAMDNRIVVKEQKFAVISSKAIDGKFKIDNVKADISYAKAAQLKKNKVSTNFHIVCASKAVIV